MSFKEFDTVVMKADFPRHGLKAAMLEAWCRSIQQMPSRWNSLLSPVTRKH